MTPGKLYKIVTVKQYEGKFFSRQTILYPLGFNYSGYPSSGEAHSIAIDSIVMFIQVEKNAHLYVKDIFYRVIWKSKIGIVESDTVFKDIP